MKKLDFKNGSVVDVECPHLTLVKPPGHKYYQCAMCGKKTKSE